VLQKAISLQDGLLSFSVFEFKRGNASVNPMKITRIDGIRVTFGNTLQTRLAWTTSSLRMKGRKLVVTTSNPCLFALLRPFHLLEISALLTIGSVRAEIAAC